MRLIPPVLTLIGSVLLCSCIHKGPNPDDPYEPINREIYKFNMAFDATMLKPVAKIYKAVLPGKIREGINNAYNNVNMIPTTANDLLQAEWGYALKDSWRFIINSTFGIAGIWDPAAKWGLPPRSNDLGITLAKWGDKKSPYIVIPFLGPSTIRDGMGMMFEYSLLTPYPYIEDQVVLYSLLGLRYVDLRSQLLDTERLMSQALDQYAFLRDAYLQHRQYQITGQQQGGELGTLYVDEEEELGDFIDDEPAPTDNSSSKPTDQEKNAARHPVSA